MNPNDSIHHLKGVGEKREKILRKLGIETVYDLLTYFPRDYMDFNTPTQIVSLCDGEHAVFSGFVKKKLTPYITRNYSIYKAVVSDGTNNILLTFFNNEFSYQKLVLGEEYIFCGTVKGNLLSKECNSPYFISAKEQNKLVPKYHLTEGITQGIIKNCLKNALDSCTVTEPFCDKILEKYQLMDYNEALRKIHFPANEEEYRKARRRLAFQELLTLQLGLGAMKEKRRMSNGIIMHDTDISEFYSALSFRPTNAQFRAIKESSENMRSGTPMNRLLQGDVGSGKTLVAAALAFLAAKNGYQSAIMAPTEMLAQQHYESITAIIEPLGIETVLLTGSMTAKEKRETKSLITSGTAAVVVGTHALIQKNVDFKKLGLVVTDEQHRFGVNQRAALAEKGDNPHTLVMSATPIPRTLAFLIYGDLDVSVLDEMPRGRKPIKTYAVDSSFNQRLMNFIKKHVSEGKQAYIVCPLIEESDKSEKQSAAGLYEKINQKYLCGIPSGLLHGKMKQAEKTGVMEKFRRNEIKVLVATTVIEVGIDVPNAVIMIIENAEQFGLSQLHQLRGRIGRGSEESYCILVSDNESAYTKERLEKMVSTSNGFEIANHDLKLRGPGDFFGKRQHGLPMMKIADIATDISLINEAKSLSDKILSEDSRLELDKNAELKKMIDRLFGGDSAANTI